MIPKIKLQVFPFWKIISNIFKDSISSVAVSHDSTFIVCATEKSIIVLQIKNEEGTYIFESIQRVHTIAQPHKGFLFFNISQNLTKIFLDPITSVTISPDSKFIISGSEDKSINIFDIKTGKHFTQFTNAHEGRKFHLNKYLTKKKELFNQ